MVTNPFGQGLSLRLSARTRDFEDGVDDARNSLAEFGSSAIGSLGPLQALQGRADEAGDEIADVGREATQASVRLGGLSAASATTGGAFSALSIGTQGLSLSFGSLVSSLTGTVGLLSAVAVAAGALLSTLVPLAAILGTMTAGFGAVAGVLGLIVGSGAVAYHEELTEAGSSLTRQLEILVGQLKEIVAEFGEEFIPLVAAAINAIPDLVRNVLDAVGGVETFVEALRDFGRAAFRVIPQVAGFMADLARRAMPVLRDFFGWLLRNGGAIFDAMLRTTQRLAPVMLRFLDAIIQAGPQINELGTRVLGSLVPALSGLLGTLDELFTRAFDQDMGLFGAITSMIGDALNNLADWMEGGGQRQIRNVLINLFNSLASILLNNRDNLEDRIVGPIQAILSGVFNALANALSSPEGGAMGAALGRFVAALGNTLFDAVLEYVASPAFISDVGKLNAAITNAFGRALVGAGLELAVPSDQFDIETTAEGSFILSQTGPAVPQRPGGETASNESTEVNVNVEGSGPLAQAFEDMITVELNKQGEVVFNQTGSR